MRGTQYTFVRLVGTLVIAGALGCGASDRETPTVGADGGRDGDGDGDGDGDEDGEASSCQTDGNDLIYVVDVDYRLLKFDPNLLATAGDPFSLIGQLDCPAGQAWDGGGAATPFSMSVDRNGFAWVLYSSGEIFKVSITDASCTATTFAPGQQGMELFGMGFVTDSAGGAAETLFISGGAADQLGSGKLAMVEPEAMTVSMVADLPESEYGPELTGTANSELFAYFPASFEDPYVARLGKTTAAAEQSWTMDPLEGFATAWAFAHWGGKFYVFISTEGFDGTLSQVRLLDPATGNETAAVPTSDYQVVGAGVSTCAPTTVD